MVELFIAIPLVVSFLVAVFFAPFWIKKAKDIGLVWDDMNKNRSDKVSGSGGIVVIISFVVGVFLFIGYRTFGLNTQENLVGIFAMLTVTILLGGIGLIDDLLGWRRGGLSIISRVILVFFAAIPLIVINAGKGLVALPFFGAFDLGIIYPLIIVPLGIIGATTTFNILAGFNGLEAGQGIILLSALGLVGFLVGESWILVIALIMVASLLGFIIYNFYPAKVFPGDSLTYAVGGLIAILPILGNFEKVAVFFYLPYIFEVILKSRGGLKKYSFAKPNIDGTIGQRYDRFYSLNHVAIFVLGKIGIKQTEKNAVYSIWVFQLLFVVIGFIIFRNSLFA